MSEFTSRINNLLIKQNLFRTDFYEAIGITPHKFYDWKKKGAIPPCPVVAKIASYLNTTIDYLITGNENPLQSRVDELEEKLRKITEMTERLCTR